MNNNQVELLRFLIKQEIELAGINGLYDAGSASWTERMLDENWEKFQQSFTDPNQYEYKSFDSIEELFEDLHANERLWLKNRLNKEDQKEITWQGQQLDSENENDMRFKKCMEIINKLEPGELTELMGEEFMEEFRRVSQR